MSAAPGSPGPDPGCRINRPLLSGQVHLPILPKRLISEDGGAHDVRGRWTSGGRPLSDDRSGAKTVGSAPTGVERRL